jgi:hypothetical protein
MRASTVNWVGQSGDWSVAANWSTGLLPGPLDDVVIPAGSSITVTHSTGSDAVDSIVCQQPFTLSGGSLSVSTTFQIDNLLNLSGGTLTGATVQANNGGVVVAGSPGGTLDGVTIEGLLDVGNTVDGANLTVTNGLVLDGTALVGNPANTYGAISFAGSQMLSGNGTVVFGGYNGWGNSSANALLVAYGGTTLTIGAGITVEGQFGTIGAAAYPWNSPNNVGLVNLGTISADISGGSVYVVAQPLRNQGQLQSPGGTLILGGSIASGGLGAVQSGNGVLALSGFLTNDDQILTLAGTNNTLTLLGGIIHGGTLVVNSGNSLTVSSGTLDGLTVDGTLDVGNTVNAASLTVTNGLTLNGNALMGNATNYSYGMIAFAGSQLLGGGGTVVFGNGNPSYNALRLANDGTSLTISSAITVRGQNGTLGYSSAFGGPQDISVTNQGTISADVSGGTIYVTGQPFVNQGQLQSPAGTLNLAGTIAAGGLGSVQSGNGVLGLSGFLANNSQVIILAQANSVLTLLSGGTIQGGTVVATNGCSLTVSSGILDGVTVDGTLDVGNTVNGASLVVTNYLVLNGTALVGNPSNGSYGVITFAGSQLLGGSGTVVFGNGNPSYNALRLANDGATLVISSGITVQGQNGTVGYTSVFGGPQDISVINQGTISANVGGGTVYVAAQPFVNQGQLQSPAGTLNLAGTIAAGSLASVQCSNGVFALSGFVTNDNQVINLIGTNNALTLESGGTIHGGTVVATNNGDYLYIYNGALEGVTVDGTLVVGYSAILNGVEVNGTLDVGNSYDGAYLTVTNGLVLDGTALVGNSSNQWWGEVTFAGSQQLQGDGTVVFGNQPYLGYNALRLNNDGSTLIISSGITVEGMYGTIGYSPVFGGPQDISVINQGAISADVSGGTIAVEAEPFYNQGLAQATNGGTLSLVSLWNNTGTLFANGGELNLEGNFDQADIGTLINSNGTIYVTGTFTNTGTLNLNATSGSWLLGGTILGGRVITSGGASLLIYGSATLNGVTLNGTLDVGNTYTGASLAVTNGLILNGSALVGNAASTYGAIVFDGSQTLGGNGTVVFGGYNGWSDGSANALPLLYAGTTLTIGPGITVEGQTGTIGGAAYPWASPANVTVINQGTISANVSGGLITVNAQPFENQGLAQATNGGSLTLNGAWNNSGSLIASGGNINLQGNFALTNVGAVSQTNGQIYVTGTFTNTGALTLNAASGSWVFGGTILGGSVSTTGGASLIFYGSCALNGVTVNGTLDVGNTFNGVYLTVTNGLVLNGTALLGNPTNQAWGEITFAGSQLLGGDGMVVFGNQSDFRYNALRLANDGTSLTIGSGITVRGQSGTVGYSAVFTGPQDISVINLGTISAEVSEATIMVNAQPFINQGQLQSPAGTLNLAGTIASGGLGSVQSSNGVLGLSGFLTNDNQTITLPGTNNALTLLSGGIIHGGTVIATNGDSLTVSVGTLDGVTVDGMLDVGNSVDGASLTVTNGLILNGTALVGNPTNGWWGGVGFAGSESLNRGATVIFGNSSYDALWLTMSGTTLVIEPGASVRGQTGWIGTAPNYPWDGPTNVTIVNQGTISADVSGGNIVVEAQSFSSQGTLQTPGGTLNVGYMENAGQTFVVGAGSGSLTLSGGLIHGGSILMSNDARLIVDSLTLDGVTVNGNLDIGNQFTGAVLSVTNGLTLNGTAYVGSSDNANYGSIAFAGNQSLTGDGTVVFGESAYNALWLTLGGSTLVLGPTVTVRGESGSIGSGVDWGGPANASTVNQGTISTDEPGGSVALSGTSFENDGLLEVQDGTGLQPTAGTVTNTGTIRIDRATVTFPGDFIQTSGTLDFGLGSPGGNGEIVFSGAASVNGTLAAHLEDGYAPAPGDLFAVMNYGTNFVAFTNFDLPEPELWATNRNNGILSLFVTNGYQLEVSVSLSNQLVAVGSVVVFNAIVDQPGEFSFQWLENGFNLRGATNSSLVLNGVSKANSGAYSVAATSLFTSVTSSPVQLTVMAPAVILAPPTPASVHVGSDVTFNVGASGDPPLAYQWFFNGAPVTWATGPSLLLSGVGRPQAGVYSVAVSNVLGSVTSAPVALTILTGPDCQGAPAGMLAWWRGEDNAYDYAGTNDLTFLDAAYAPGEVGQAFVFNGANSYLTAPANGLAPSGTNDFSLEFWANFSALTPSTMGGDGSVVFVARDEGLGDLNKWLFGFGGGSLYFYLNAPGLGPQFLASALFAPATNQWYHLAVTRGGNIFRVYVDGAQVSLETSGLAIPPANAPLTIGEAQGLFMQGLLDEISIYNRALAANELLAIYQEGSQGKCQSSQPLTMGQAAFNSSGQFQFQILGGQLGAAIQVQASSDLAHWTNVGQTINTNGVETFADPAARNARRFYRASSTQ